MSKKHESILYCMEKSEKYRNEIKTLTHTHTEREKDENQENNK